MAGESPRRSRSRRSVRVLGRWYSGAVLQRRQVVGDRHHHPEDSRDAPAAPGRTRISRGEACRRADGQAAGCRCRRRTRRGRRPAEPVAAGLGPPPGVWARRSSHVCEMESSLPRRAWGRPLAPRLFGAQESSIGSDGRPRLRRRRAGRRARARRGGVSTRRSAGGAPGRGASRGAAAAGQARHRPNGAGHPSRPCRRARPPACVPGRRATSSS